MQRTIFMGGEVEDFGADALVSQLLLLDSQDQGKDIKLFINSPGKSVASAHECRQGVALILSTRDR
jgi:ATP-dependent Clp protease protease subunit